MEVFKKFPTVPTLCLILSGICVIFLRFFTSIFSVQAAGFLIMAIGIIYVIYALSLTDEGRNFIFMIIGFMNIIFGVIVLFNPQMAADMIASVIGLVFFAIGVVQFIYYLREKMEIKFAFINSIDNMVVGLLVLLGSQSMARSFVLGLITIGTIMNIVALFITARTYKNDLGEVQ